MCRCICDFQSFVSMCRLFKKPERVLVQKGILICIQTFIMFETNEMLDLS